MTALDRAASLVHDATCRDNQHDGPESDYPCVELAREVLKAGQHEPRTITTVEELHALPVGTVVQVNDGSVAKRVDSDIYDGLDWMFVGSDEYREPSEFEFMFPATPLTAQPTPNEEPLGQIDAERLFAVLAHYDSEVERAQKSFAGPPIAILAGADLANGIRAILKDAGLTVAGESDG